MDPRTSTAPPADAARAALLRHLPAIERLRGHAALTSLDAPAGLCATLCREAVAQVRAAILEGQLGDAAAIDGAIAAALQRGRAALDGPSLRRIINGTGVLLHTNAGRAPLPRAALTALVEAARGYSNLEVSLETGRRGSRQQHVRSLLRWLSGAEDALVVNNCAAAVMLALHALARGRRVLVSRGELVEIGGGFRIPEVLTAAGARLVEVGTTNRTHLRDFEAALAQAGSKGHDIAAILAVHRSNFALVGFSATPAAADLAALAHRHGLPLVVDLGSGAPRPLQLAGGAGELARREPTIPQLVAAGADLVAFSGDKLLGGPQAGILVGRASLIARLARNPMARALRVDPLTLAPLESVLRTHLFGRAEAELPALHALALPQAELEVIATALAETLGGLLGKPWTVAVVPSEARPGGGTDPLVRVPSLALAFTVDGLTAPALAARLRNVPVPVLGRVRGDRMLVDVRTLVAGAEAMEPGAVALELLASLRHAVP